MKGATLKVARESLGLSTRWLADHWQIREQAVQRWETRNAEIPAELADDFLELISLSDRVMKSMFEVDELKLPRKDDSSTASTMSAQFLRAAAGRAILANPVYFATTKISWVDEESPEN
jgi:hypothetical protein